MKFIEFRIILFIASWTMLHGHLIQNIKNKLHNKHTVITDNDESDVKADKSNNHEIGVNSQTSLKYNIVINPVGTLSNTLKYGVDASKKIGGLSSSAIQTGKEAIVSAAEKLGSIVSKKSKVTVDYKVEEDVMKSHELHGSVGTHQSVEVATGLKGSSGEINIQLHKNGQHQYGTNYDQKSSVTANNAYQTSLFNSGISGLSSQSLYRGTTENNFGLNSELHEHGESAVNYNQEATGFSGHGFQAHGLKSTEHFSYSSPQQLIVESNENGQHQHGTNHNYESSATANDAYQTSLPNLGISGIWSQSLYGGSTGTNVGVKSKLHQHEESAANYNQRATGFSDHGFQAHRSGSTGHFGYSSPIQLTGGINEISYHQYGTNHNYESSATANDANQMNLLNLGKPKLSSQSIFKGYTKMNIGVKSKLHQHKESAANYNQEATGFSGHEFQAHGSGSTGHFGYSSPIQLTGGINEISYHQYETKNNHESSVTGSDAYQTDLRNSGKLGLSSKSLYGGSMSVNIGVSKSIADKHHFRDKVELKNNLNSNSEGIIYKPFKLVSRVAGKLQEAAKSAARTGITRAQTTTQLLKNGITIKGEISLNHKADNHVSSSHH